MSEVPRTVDVVAEAAALRSSVAHHPAARGRGAHRHGESLAGAAGVGGVWVGGGMVS
jgi:hypothetical protein